MKVSTNSIGSTEVPPKDIIRFHTIQIASAIYGLTSNFTQFIQNESHINFSPVNTLCMYADIA